VESFDPHVLLELDGLRAGIEQEADATVRAELGLVLSAILVKVSRKESDASRRRGERRLAAGFTTRLFVRKAEELAGRLADFDGALATRAYGRVTVDDATRLESVPPGSVDAVITSPPYAATYDYQEHHALRLRWLDLDARKLERGEMGARRRYASMTASAAREAWTSELTQFLGSAARTLAKGGRLVVVLGDSIFRGERLRGDAAILKAGARAGLTFVARASQEQRSPHLRDPRIEHVVLLTAT